MSEAVVLEETQIPALEEHQSRNESPSQHFGRKGLLRLIVDNDFRSQTLRETSAEDRLIHEDTRIALGTISISEAGSADESSYDPRKDELQPEYPNYVFSFNKTWVEGQGVVMPTVSSRMRAVLEAVRTHEPDTVSGLNPDIVSKQYRQLLKHSEKEVKVGDKIMRRDNLLEISDAVGTQFVRLIRINHPLAQALVQFTEKYPDANRANIEVYEALITSISFDEIKEHYTRIEKDARKVLS